MYEDELYHYGVKGMKWGVRKAQTSSSANKNYNSKQRKERKEKIKKTAKKGAKKAVKALSTIGSLYLTDQLFYGGAGTRAAGKAGKAAARTAIKKIGKMRGVDVTWI